MLSQPDEAAAHADAIAIGDGVRTRPRVLRDLEAGTLQRRYAATYESDYDDDPAPRRELLPRESFYHGQPHRHARLPQPLRILLPVHRRAAHALPHARSRRHPDQFERSGEPYAVFIDNNLGSRPEYLRELCRALRPLERIWSAAVSLDVTDDPTLVREMALAGCTGVFVGFESLADDNLAAARKRTPRARDYARRVQLLHENGIQVNGSFVLGFDEDRRDAFATLAGWIEDNRLECATFHILTPYPGTPLFRQMEAEGRILHRDWARYDTAHVVFRPRHMSPEELQLGYDWLYRRLFSLPSIWRRRPRHTSAVLPYLAMSCLYKRSNRIWYWLIKHRLVHQVWSPLVH